MLGEREVVRNTGKQAIVSFLEAQTCYSVLRASGKVVVFDTRIPIQLAFYALVEHGEYGINLFGLCFICLSLVGLFGKQLMFGRYYIVFCLKWICQETYAVIIK